MSYGILKPGDSGNGLSSIQCQTFYWIDANLSVRVPEIYLNGIVMNVSDLVIRTIENIVFKMTEMFTELKSWLH